MRTAQQIGHDAKQLWRLCLVNGSFDEGRVRVVADDLIASRHSSAPPILRQFLRLVRLDRARHAARVESAAPLDPAVRAEVEAGLALRYGHGITATFVVDPALIAGMRVTVGSDVYDGTLRGGLAALQAGF